MLKMFVSLKVDSAGIININNTKSVISQNFARQNWQAEIVDDSVEKCVGEISEKPNLQLDKFGLKCSTKMAALAYCMWREYFISCPASQQNKSRQCERLRMVLKRRNENKFVDK